MNDYKLILKNLNTESTGVVITTEIDFVEELPYSKFLREVVYPLSRALGYHTDTIDEYLSEVY